MVRVVGERRVCCAQAGLVVFADPVSAFGRPCTPVNVWWDAQLVMHLTLGGVWSGKQCVCLVEGVHSEKPGSMHNALSVPANRQTRQLGLLQHSRAVL